MKITATGYNYKTSNTKSNITFQLKPIVVEYKNLEAFNIPEKTEKINALKKLIGTIVNDKKVKRVAKQAKQDIELNVNCDDTLGADTFEISMNKPYDFGLPMHDKKATIFDPTQVLNNKKSLKELTDKVIDIIKMHTGLRQPSNGEYLSEQMRMDL